MKTNQISEIQDLAEKHAAMRAAKGSANWQDQDSSVAQTEQRDTQPDNWEDMSEAEQDSWMRQHAEQRDTAQERMIAETLRQQPIERTVTILADDYDGLKTICRHYREKCADLDSKNQLLAKKSAHAERLAEALTDAIYAMRQGNRITLEEAIAVCEPALAAWEAAQ